MIKNAIFAEFRALVALRYEDDEDIVFQVQLAEAMNGVSLDALYDEQPALAMRLTRAFKMVANDVAQGRADSAFAQLRASGCRDSFVKLVQLLDRFHPEVSA